MHEHVFLLPNSKGAVGGLVFHRRVPPPIEMDDMGGRGEIEPRATGFDGEHEKGNTFVVLELAHQVLALSYLGLAMQYEARASEYGAEEFC